MPIDGAPRTRDRIAIVLAAGKSTRMRSKRSKVLHEVGGKSSLLWVLELARASGCHKLFVVVGPDSDDVVAAVGEASDITWVVQEERRGTGHAVQVAAAAVQAAQATASIGSTSTNVTALVLYADAPLVTVETLGRLFDEAESGFGALSVATLVEPGNLGRVMAAPDGQLEAIIEAADANHRELEIGSVNAGHYALPFPKINHYLDALEPANQQGELYLTDAVVAAAKEHPVRCVELADPSESWGINTRADLARVHAAFCQRAVERLQVNGVTVLRPDTVTVEATVSVASDCVLHPGVTLLGETSIGEGTEVHTGAWLKDCQVAEECEIRPYSVLQDTVLDSRCGVGPFARLRGGAHLEEGVHIGNFVEVKKSRLGKGVKAGHLAYLGDATVGAKSNIGAGVVTCNYDGESKHQTEIGEGAFVGSDSMLVAPVRVGNGATTAAGSVITASVPDGALGVGRARQRNIEGWQDRQSSLRASREAVGTAEATSPDAASEALAAQDD